MARTGGSVNPFGPIKGEAEALRLARMSSAGFILATTVGLVQAGAVWVSPLVEMQGVAVFAIFLAGVTGLLAVIQWRKPNRFLPVLGIAWGLYELSAFVTAALVGIPLIAEGVPLWPSLISALGLGVCLILHIGGLRGSVALGRKG